METIYIYKTPFDGKCWNTMTENIVHYTGEQVNTPTFDERGYRTGVQITFKNPLSFEEYNAQNGGNMEKATEEEFFKMLENYEAEKVCSLFKEITPERWDDLLNCLPPARWHDYENLNIFFMSECYTSNIYYCCIKDRDTGKFYSALRRINETSAQIKETFLKSI